MTKIVKFLAAYQSYVRGDVAGFAPDIASKLVHGEKVAEYYVDATESEETASNSEIADVLERERIVSEAEGLLEGRKQSLAEAETDLAGRVSSLEASEAALKAREEGLAELEADLAAREAALVTTGASKDDDNSKVVGKALKTAKKTATGKPPVQGKK